LKLHASLWIYALVLGIVFDQSEQLAGLFAPISALLTTEEMQRLTSQLGVDRLPSWDTP
jgi:hypothetical protein